MELFFAEDAGEFAEGEEGDQCDEEDERAGGELLHVDLVYDGPGGLVMDEALDELLEKVEGKDKEAEEEGLEEDRLVEGASLGAAAELHHLADEDDLTDDEGIDEREAEGERRIDVGLAADEYGVGGEGAEEDGEIG